MTATEATIRAAAEEIVHRHPKLCADDAVRIGQVAQILRKHLNAPEQAPRVCVQCGYKEFAYDKPLTHCIKCHHEFPASVADGGVEALRPSITVAHVTALREALEGFQQWHSETGRAAYFVHSGWAAKAA